MNSAPLNIAIFLPAMNDGGAERALVNLANELTKRGTHKVRFILLRHEGVYLDQINSAIPVEGISKSGDVLLALPALVKKLKETKPDILITSLPITDLMAIWACKLMGKSAPKHICNIQNMRAQQFETFTKLRSKIKAKAMIAFYKKAQYFAAVSKAIAGELESVFKVTPGKISVIPNSLDLGLVRAQKDVSTDHKWLGSNRDHKTIIAVGRLVVQKDYPTLLAAMKILKDKGDTKLIILGDGPEKEAIEKQISDMGLQDTVDLAGFQKNPFSLVAAIDAFVLSSAWEGFGNVIIEALSVGTPVVATNCPGAPSEILEDGKYGALVPIKNPSALAEAIEKTLNGDRPPKEVLITRASEYSIENITDSYEQLFTRIIT